MNAEQKKIEPGYYWAIPVWDFTPTTVFVDREGRVDVLGFDHQCSVDAFEILEKIQPPANTPTPDEIATRRGMDTHTHET